MKYLLEENEYKEQMETVVQPYLEKIGRERMVEREPEKKIHLMDYTPSNPKGCVLISHGYTESIEKYLEMIFYFAKMGYHVYMHEHCGHGKSYRLISDPSLVHVDDYQRYVEDLLYIAHLCKLENPNQPLYLYAHSMGGGIGAAALGTEPDLFKKAVLTSPMIRPATGTIPWSMAEMMTETACYRGRQKEYALNQNPYSGKETFEESSSLSRARFEFYQSKRNADKTLQTCACTYGWLRETTRLNNYLKQSAWKKITVPVLMFQASDEYLVSKSEQERFIRKVNRNGICPYAKMVPVAGSKHEIYSATPEILNKYWNMIFSFLDDVEENV